jgi:hypothetical protein
VWYDWDESKNHANHEKHGVDFKDVFEFQWDTVLEVPDERKDYGESRWIALGLVGTRLHTLIYTKRHRAIRVISLRKSNVREVTAYESQKS